MADNRRAYIKHITSHYPENIFEFDINDKRIKRLGVVKKHYVSSNESVSDLIIIAGNKLLDEYNIDRNNIDAVLVCTQTPDFQIPATSGIVQDRLGITKKSLCFDITSGCNGYIHTLSVAKGLIESGQIKNALIFNADIISTIINPQNLLSSLFGDSAAATFIDSVESDKEYLHSFVFGTDGSGYNHIIKSAPSYKHRDLSWEEMTREVKDENGSISRLTDLFIDDTSIGLFVLNVLPDIVKDILLLSKLTYDDIDQFFFHQSNKVVMDAIRNLLDISKDKLFMGFKNIGNTSSASIPNAIELYIKDNHTPITNMLVGFGVGLSWGGCIADLSLLER